MFDVRSPNELGKFEYRWEFDLKPDHVEFDSRSPEFTMNFCENSSHLKVEHSPDRNPKELLIFLVWNYYDQEEPTDVDFVIGEEEEDGVLSNGQIGSFQLERGVNKETFLGSFDYRTSQKITFYVALYGTVTTTASIRNLAKISLCNDLLKAFQTPAHSDVIVDVAGSELRAHKAILSARSPVFAAMFRHDMAENRSNRVEITDVSVGAMNELLNFVYGAEIAKWTEELAVELLKASNKYGILDLFEQCEKYLMNLVTESNATALLDVADVYGATKLKDSAQKFVCENSENLEDPAETANEK